jgi:23S rRNA pseudouridine1911/1915/1917 synthase
MTVSDLTILYEDNHVLGVFKPAGVLVQGDRTGDTTLLELAKLWLIEKYQKPGNAFLGLVHRLDRPVAGVVIFAKTSKAASRLSHQFRARTIQKSYLAVVEGRLSPPSGTLVHYIRKHERRNRPVHIAETPFEDAKRAELSYALLEEADGNSLVQIQIQTGRHHQIRAQLAALGHPIIGDYKYRSRQMLPERKIALFALQICFKHPTLDQAVTVQAPLPDHWPWTLFHLAQVCS